MYLCVFVHTVGTEEYSLFLNLCNETGCHSHELVLDCSLNTVPDWNFGFFTFWQLRVISDRNRDLVAHMEITFSSLFSTLICSFDKILHFFSSLHTCKGIGESSCPSLPHRYSGEWWGLPSQCEYGSLGVWYLNFQFKTMPIFKENLSLHHK
jgi:hypothetical protein